MMRAVWRTLSCLPCLAMLLAFEGCNKAGTKNAEVGNSAAPEGGARADGVKSTRAIMIKLAKGPQSLTTVIGKELEQQPTPWAALKTQSKEYLLYAADLGKNEPSKGSKKSWADLTAAFTAAATSLDKAVQAQDLDKASEAHQTLAGSCTECHREHRTMGGRGPGGGGPGGGPGGPGGRGPGGFGQRGPGGPGAPGEILGAFLQEQLKLTAEQKQLLAKLQTEVDQGLDKLLTAEQKTQLKTMQQRGGRGGPGRGERRGPGGPPGLGGPPPGGPEGPPDGPRGGGAPPGGRGGPGGFGGPPAPGQVLPVPIQNDLSLSAEQKQQLATLQKVVDSKLGSILSDEQKKQLKDSLQNFGPPGRGGRGPGGFGGPDGDMPPPGGRGPGRDGFGGPPDR